MSASKRKSSKCDCTELTKKEEESETQEIPITKKVKIESKKIIKAPFADTITSDDESDSDDSS
jgi:hypothetical protein